MASKLPFQPGEKKYDAATAPFLIHLFRLTATVAFGTVLTTCNATPKHQNFPANANQDGMRLLYTLASKQKDVDKLLFIKNEQPDVRTVIVKIAAAFSNAADQIESFFENDPSMRLDDPVLPDAELRTRASIESARAKALLFSSGEKFEVQLLLSQAEGLSYGTHLARTASEAAEDPARRAYLHHLDQELSTLYEDVLALIHSRYRLPETGKTHSKQPENISTTADRASF